MGLDLTLIPMRYPSCWLAHAEIDCNRNYEFFDKIKELESEFTPLQQPIKACLGDRYEIHYNDAYGQPLKYITAGKLADHFKDVHLDDWPNDAALAYIRALPAHLPVVLYWC